jgi:hypothetical protein
MASESAGTVYTEIRLLLDNLQKDIEKSGKLFAQIESKAGPAGDKVKNGFDAMGKAVSKSLSDMSKTGLGQLTKMLEGMGKAVMAAPIVGLVLGIVAAVKKLFSAAVDWIKETSGAYTKHQQEIAKVGAVIKTTGAAAWTSARQMKDMAQEISNTTGRTVNEIMQMQSVLLGFKKITGEAFERTSKAIVDMAAVMGGDLASAANTVGKALDSPVEGMTALSRQGFIFTQQEKEMVAELVKSGKQLEAQNVILKAMEDAFKGTAKAINDVNRAQSELASLNEQIKIAQGEMTSGFVHYWTNVIIEMKKTKLEALQLRNALDKAEKADYSQHIEQIEQLTKKLEEAKTELEKITIGELLTKARLELNIDMFNDKLVIAENNLREFQKRQEELNARGFSTPDNLQNQIKDAEEAVRRRKRALAFAESQAEQANRAAAERAAALAIENAEMAQIEDQAKKIEEAEQGRINTLAEINRAQNAGLISAEEAANQRTQAYKTEADTLNNIITSVKNLELTNENAIGKQKEIINQLTGSLSGATGNYIKLKDAIEAAANAAEDLAREQKQIADQELAGFAMSKKIQDLEDQYVKLTGTTKEIMDLERKRVWEAIENSDDYINATQNMKDKVKAAFEEIYNISQKKDPWKSALSGIQKYGSQAASILSAGLQIWTVTLERETDKLREELEKRYKLLFEALEKEKQAKLYAMGYAEAATEEQHQRELEIAVESGDQRRIYKAQDEYEKWKIEDEYAQKKKALEEQMAKEKAALDYKVAVAQWQTSLMNAIIAAAMATLSGFMTQPFIPAGLIAGGMAAGLGAAQVAVVSANKPKMQTFASGGIVGGTSYSGDNMITRQNSREMDLNLAQQKNLFDKINNNDLGDSKNITVVIPVYLDGQVLTKIVVERINNREELINQGSIVG